MYIMVEKSDLSGALYTYSPYILFLMLGSLINLIKKKQQPPPPPLPHKKKQQQQQKKKKKKKKTRCAKSTQMPSALCSAHMAKTIFPNPQSDLLYILTPSLSPEYDLAQSWRFRSGKVAYKIYIS